MKAKLLGLISCVALIGVSQARADITYCVDFVWAPGSVVGTITTDGKPGPLSKSDIKNWNLTISNQYGSSTVTGPPHVTTGIVEVMKNPLTATPS
jgi:hypothetical protein